MFSFAFSRFYLCYLPQDGTKMANPHPCHCYGHLLMGWVMDQDNNKTGQWLMTGITGQAQWWTMSISKIQKNLTELRLLILQISLLSNSSCLFSA